MIALLVTATLAGAATPPADAPAPDAAPAPAAEAAPAAPDPRDAAAYSRLFGADADAVPLRTDAASPDGSPWRLVGPAVLLAVGAGAAWVMKRRVKAAGGQPITIVSRQALGDRSALVLVEVVDAEGETRRLLLGTGSGAPALLADLGASLRDLAPPELPPSGFAVPGPAAPNIAAEILAERRAPEGAARESRRGLP